MTATLRDHIVVVCQHCGGQNRLRTVGVGPPDKFVAYAGCGECGENVLPDGQIIALHALDDCDMPCEVRPGRRP